MTAVVDIILFLKQNTQRVYHEEDMAELKPASPHKTLVSTYGVDYVGKTYSPEWLELLNLVRANAAGAFMNDGAFIFLLIVLLVYFLPTIVASNKKKSNTGAIFFVNLVFGWTLLGWGIAMVWALTNDVKSQVVNIHSGNTPAQVEQNSIAAEVAKLSELYKSGDLTEAEFSSLKAKLIGG